MSWSPQALAGKVPTGVVFSGDSPFLNLPKLACLVEMVSPKKKAVVVPARQAYSHSASVGRRYGFLSFSRNFLMNSWQSSQETISAGMFFFPLYDPPLTACHCSFVTGYTPMYDPLSR